MVTQPQARPTQTRPKTNRHNVIKRRTYMILVVSVLIGAIIGFIFGRITAPEKVRTVTVTETVEVPVYETIEVPVDRSVLPIDTSNVFLYDVPLSTTLQKYIYNICADKGVPVALALAMIEHESNFNPEIVSVTNDYGLMQINVINHDHLQEKYHCADMTDPYQNVFCGVSIIGSYIEKYEGDYTKALMVYNMGDYGARKAWNSGITSTKYSVKIIELMEKYEEVRYDKQKTRQ